MTTPQDRYRAANITQLQIALNKRTEQDLIDWLDGRPNKSGYVKQLIRKDMARAARAAARKAQNK